MFPQFKRLNNNSGIVLFIVLMTAIIIMLFSVGILTQSMNEINYAQQQIDQITSDQLAKGLWWNAYSSEMSSAPSPGVYMSSGAPGGRDYDMNMTPMGVTTTYINSYQVSVNYDTF